MALLPVRYVGKRDINGYQWDEFIVEGFDPSGPMPELHVPDIGDWPAGGLKPAPIGGRSADVICKWPNVLVRGPRADIALRPDRIGLIVKQ